MRIALHILLCIITVQHDYIFSAELLTLSAQLEQFAHAPISPKIIAATLAPVHILDFSKHPCIDHKNNTLAPKQPFNFVTKNNISVQIIQPMVTWQDLSCAAFLQPDDYTKYFAQLDGYTTTKQFNFFWQELKKNNITGSAEFDQLKSISKGRSCRLGGGDASCGYHAIAHLETIVKAITTEHGSKHLSELLDLRRINDHFGFKNVRRIWHPKTQEDGDWRQAIINAPKKPALIQQYLNVSASVLQYAPLANQDGEWLEVNGIQFLLKHLKKSDEDLEHNILWRIQHAGPERLTELLEEKFRLDDMNPCVAACICHGESIDKTQNTSHWFGVAVSRNKDQMQIIILDSKNKPRFDHPNVLKIIRDATGKTITELRAEFSLTEQLQQPTEISPQTARHEVIFDLLSSGNTQQEIEKIIKLTNQEQQLYFGSTKTTNQPTRKPSTKKQVPKKK
jgi:hypothetical protein